MFAWREQVGDAEIVFTDSSVDLVRPEGRARVGDALGVGDLLVMRQVHGAVVAEADPRTPGPEADALVTTDRGVAIVARAADCVPIALVADGAVAVVHAGRAGVVAGVATAAVSRLRASGATTAVRAWVGPHICGRCYEVPEALAEAVEAAVPGTRSVTSWGTPAVDLGAGVVGQLRALDVEVHDLGRCTLEDRAFFSHRRGDAGRHGAIVVRR